MVQQRSDRRDDLRLSRGDADHHLLRTVEVRINRLFPLYVFHFARSFSPSLFFSSPFFFLLLLLPFLSFFFLFSQFFPILRNSKTTKKKGMAREARICKIAILVPRPKHATEAGHRLVFTHSTLRTLYLCPHRTIIGIRSSSCNYKRSTMQSRSIKWHAVGAPCAISWVGERSVYRLVSWYLD